MEASNSIGFVGKTLQDKRIQNNMTVRELAKLSGVSSGMISQIERGLANPSLNTITKLASSLGLQLSLFFDSQIQEKENQVVVRKSQRQKMKVDDPNFVYELLIPDLNHALEFIWVESAPGSSTEGSPFQHEGEECGLLLSGTLEVHVGGEQYTLKSGDSIIFDSSKPHWYHNPGPERVLSVWAITPPTF